MLDNTITLSVDYLNDSNTTDEVYSRQDEFQNRSVYTGPDHTLSERDTMSFYRTYPKQSGNFRGTAKSAIKFSQDVQVDGVDASTSVNAVEIGEISFSLPVGTTAAAAKILRQRMIAALDDDTLMAKLNDKLEI